METPLLALTMGEPGGIAGEISFGAWQQFRDGDELCFFVIGDVEYFRKAGNGLPIVEITSPEDARVAFNSGLPIMNLPLANAADAGIADTGNAASVISSIDKAVEFAIAGKVDGLVTNPIQKESLYAAEFNHQGHTDYLADLARRAGLEADPVMMLSAKNLRTVPISVHIAIKDVPGALSKELIMRQSEITAGGLKRWFGIRQPVIAITGLNPHAGEGGAMGREEIEFISPAIKALAEKGFDVHGPLPADTLFHEEGRAGFDVVMCMYHDQALIPVKTLGFHDGVNTTLGLPFVRTSPDHGTALGLAGKGVANPSSLIAALRQAALMARNGRSGS